MGLENRRTETRIHLQMFMNEHEAAASRRCMSSNLSPQGIYLNSLKPPSSSARPGAGSARVVGLEFELPGTAETIWAAGQVCYATADKYFCGTGLRFVGIAEKHRRLVRDYVLEERERQLRQILATVRRNRALYYTARSR